MSTAPLRPSGTGPAPNPRRSVRLEWTGDGLKFNAMGTAPTTPPITIDGDNQVAPGPMLTLLLAAASCSAADVALIVKKMRVTLTQLSVEVTGVRRDEEPRRYVAMEFHYRMGGDGLTAEQADRAVKLSLERYCSVVHSLAPDIKITSTVELAE